MADVKSKNPFELLGDEDDNGETSAPVKTVDKNNPRSTKRNAPEPKGAQGTRREEPYRGSATNRGKPVEDGGREDRAPRRGGDRGRGGRGGRGREFRDTRDDRHSHGRPNDHPKQAEQSWGAPTGGSEWEDEKAGEAIAKADAKDGETGADGAADADAAAPEAEPEPEDNSKSYADYLAEQAEKKLNLGTTQNARKPNEGAKMDKKWAGAKQLNKDDEEDSYMAPQGGKTQRLRERKEKNVLEIDHRYVEQRGGDRGRGGRGRGGDRGRGGRGGRGEYRGGRGEYRGRGGRGGSGETLPIEDKNAFPSLS